MRGRPAATGHTRRVPRPTEGRRTPRQARPALAALLLSLGGAAWLNATATPDPAPPPTVGTTSTTPGPTPPPTAGTTSSTPDPATPPTADTTPSAPGPATPPTADTTSATPARTSPSTPVSAPASMPPTDDFAPFPHAALEARYRELIAKLRCLVCQNEALADSHAPLAADLRREVRGMLEAGQTDAAILTFLTQRYGDFVLYDPPLNARTALLWAGPPLLLVLGVVWLGTGLARRARRAVAPIPLDADTRAAVGRALDEET